MHHKNRQPVPVRHDHQNQPRGGGQRHEFDHDFEHDHNHGSHDADGHAADGHVHPSFFKVLFTIPVVLMFTSLFHTLGFLNVTFLMSKHAIIYPVLEKAFTTVTFNLLPPSKIPVFTILFMLVFVMKLASLLYALTNGRMSEAANGKGFLVYLHGAYTNNKEALMAVIGSILLHIVNRSEGSYWVRYLCLLYIVFRLIHLFGYVFGNIDAIRGLAMISSFWVLIAMVSMLLLPSPDMIQPAFQSVLDAAVHNVQHYYAHAHQVVQQLLKTYM